MSSLMDKVRKRHRQDISRPDYKPIPRRVTNKRRKHGAIPGIEPGATFPSRQACADAGVHGVVFQGIHPSPTGAFSVCLSGIYEDDVDNGNSFVYTGTGGKVDTLSSSSKHVVDQDFTNPYNKSLQMSAALRNPVRVVRGANNDSTWAPTTGYRYDGLYRVVRAYYGRRGGRRVCKFDFRRLPGQPAIPLTSMPTVLTEGGPADESETGPIRSPEDSDSIEEVL